ncbi:putative nucleoside kinase, CMP and AMP kinase [Halovivax ruber XH-70]|uniref:Putative adenylate kinase n=1 Tax=Halovivax ruber (strain DSM 18193 / JCM 13892 / XH-70) TaxID=797302 RepID=L0IC35_HALRX|nr:adenylate kinase family protein [Halovivax ruber]AGB16304.1 putative nucleoside kinase, CMP and AMP kinase [Halovivax ruber XH-70]
MRVAVTGTPGTGKTTATAALVDRFDANVEADTSTSAVTVDGKETVDELTADDICHLNDLIESESLYTDVDEDRDSVIADMDALESVVDDRAPVVVDSHLAHHLPADRVVVLRCEPNELARRLRERGEAAEKAHENAESEALDVILAEAVESHGLESVYEIDTTERTPDDVADRIVDVLTGEREPSAGTVDFVGYLQ